jgi:peptide/nickel transport system ATP-binding protein
MENKLLDIKNLVVKFHTDDGIVHAVNGLDLSLSAGETLGIVGETGAGKTTSALAIMGLLDCPPGRIHSGEIFYKGQNLLEIKEDDYLKIRGKEISMIFQDPMTALNPVMTVVDQIAEIIQNHQKVSGKEAENRAVEMLKVVRIQPERAKEYPHQFSGGMKQRVVIAMALACNPSLLIADEPTTALDVTIQAQVLEMMKDLRREFNTSMIMITHDFGIVAETCDRVAIMYAGEIIERGTLRDIFKSARHPYTIGLFGAIPDMEKDTEFLYQIEGLMPDPMDLPPGCPFSPRCAYAEELCRKQKPGITVLPGEDHAVKCHIYTGSLETKKVRRGNSRYE